MLSKNRKRRIQRFRRNKIQYQLRLEDQMTPHCGFCNFRGHFKNKLYSNCGKDARFHHYIIRMVFPTAQTFHRTFGRKSVYSFCHQKCILSSFNFCYLKRLATITTSTRTMRAGESTYSLTFTESSSSYVPFPRIVSR